MINTSPITKKQVGLISYLIFSNKYLSTLIPHNQTTKGITKVDYWKSDFEDFLSKLNKKDAQAIIKAIEVPKRLPRILMVEKVLEKLGFITAAHFYDIKPSEIGMINKLLHKHYDKKYEQWAYD